ncbi:MAG: histidine kinase [Bacteroidetes bacterium QS_9_68_14]|nr:MAG: histidine kinase [Bacteroidetes bacterium QS_9_68_14]
MLQPKMKTHFLALKVAGGVAVVAALLGAGVAGAGLAWPWAALLLAAGGGAGAYALVQRLVTRRLTATRSLLKHLRQFEFEEAEEDARPAPRRADELDALLAETRRTGRTLGEKMRELRRMENYRREFIGDVSHELKTPIFSIRGFAETLLDGALEDESVRRSFVEKILRNADRLSHLARDLAEIARIETGALEMTVTPFALRPLVEEVVESMQPAAEEKRLHLHVAFPDDLPRVEGDRERLRQVLTNLVDNAIKYNERGGGVEVAARPVGEGTVKTEVIDNGVGVAPEDVERLTERFYRVDRSRSRSQGGTGLGLAIVKHILGAHGSELTIASTPGEGSTFGFTLPATSEKRGGEGARETERKVEGENGRESERASGEEGPLGRRREPQGPAEKAVP